MSAAALAIDLGTTRLKLAALDPDGTLGEVFAVAAPEPVGEGGAREVDPGRWWDALEELLGVAGPWRSPARVGIASQRSSFLVVRGADAEPVTPIVSWQDTASAAWCADHAELDRPARERTGLLLSPHYLAPKLAARCERDPGLARGLEDGTLRVATLDAWVAGRLGDATRLRTDLSMAARTLLCDPREGAWSPELCELFGVPIAALPAIEPTSGASTPLGAHELTASIADQPAGVLAVLPEGAGSALVNFGTGAFCLRPTGEAFTPRPGYLAGPMHRAPDGRTRYALEGTINGGGRTADRFAAGPTELPATDPCPGGFCLPDEAGLGAPWWRPDEAFALSAAAARGSGDVRRRVVLEGLVFRVRQELEDLFPEAPPERVLVAGGLTHEPFVPRALAATLGRPVEVLRETEAALLGAARLAAGLAPHAAPGTRVVEDTGPGTWLAAKYGRWREWVAQRLD